MVFAEFEGKFEKLLQNVERSAIISNVAAVTSPVRRKLNGIADIAQPVERILGKDEVTSSNLVISSMSSHLRGITRGGDFFISLPVAPAYANNPPLQDSLQQEVVIF